MCPCRDLEVLYMFDSELLCTFIAAALCIFSVQMCAQAYNNVVTHETEKWCVTV